MITLGGVALDLVHRAQCFLQQPQDVLKVWVASRAAKLGVRMAAARIGVSSDAPEPTVAEAAEGRAEAEAEVKARAAALGEGGDEPASSRACVVQ